MAAVPTQSSSDSSFTLVVFNADTDKTQPWSSTIGCRLISLCLVEARLFNSYCLTVSHSRMQTRGTLPDIASGKNTSELGLKAKKYIFGVVCQLSLAIHPSCNEEATQKKKTIERLKREGQREELNWRRQGTHRKELGAIYTKSIER